MRCEVNSDLTDLGWDPKVGLCEHTDENLFAMRTRIFLISLLVPATCEIRYLCNLLFVPCNCIMRSCMVCTLRPVLLR
jgi:hypothetical protein